MFCARTASAAETQALAATLADMARPGDLIVLAGDLGAGKTTFTQGFGRRLGITEPIQSPTFTLHRSYEEGRLVLHHLDVYRFEQIEEVLDIGLAELLDGGAVTVIEWGDMINTELPADHLRLSLLLDDQDDDARRLEIEVNGLRFGEREPDIYAALAQWVVSGDAPC